MKRNLYLICGALALAACQPGSGGVDLGSASSTISTAGDKVVVQGARGLILAHNAAQGAIAIVNPLVRARVLKAEQVNQYERLIDQTEQLAAGADKSLSIAERTAKLFNIANELNALAGR